jgi:hypothetical protein
MYGLSKNEFIKAKGLDVYGFVNQNETLIPTLSMINEHRIRFYRQNLLAANLLQRCEMQPLIEQGSYSLSNDRDRDFIGEDFLTSDAVALLMYKKIYLQEKNNPQYNNSNLFIMRDDDKQEGIIKSLNLSEGEDAKIILINDNGIHHVPVYIKKEKGINKCFIVDSFGADYNPVHAYDRAKSFKSYLGEQSQIILSRTRVQHDFFSCSTFALKTTVFFSKFGENTFDKINMKSDTLEIAQGISILSPSQLPVRLLKLQKFAATPNINGINKQIVSTGKNINIDQYHENYSIVRNGNIYNAAPIMKKYKYIIELNDFLLDIGVDYISPNSSVPLPKKVQDVVDFMYSPKKEKDPVAHPDKKIKWTDVINSSNISDNEMKR